MVLFRFDPASRVGVEPRLAEMLDNLPSQIEQIRGWRHGPNLTVDADAWDYALHATFDDEADLNIYFEHPAHVAGLKALEGHLELKFVDFLADPP